MAYVIAEPCIDVLDISCVSVCPVDCIHFDEGTDRKLFIDPNECIDCGACEPECPVNAIFPEESLPPEWAKYTADRRDLVHRQGRRPGRRRRAEARLTPAAEPARSARVAGVHAGGSPDPETDAHRLAPAVGHRDRVRPRARRRARRRHPRMRLPAGGRRHAGHDPQRPRPARRRRRATSTGWSTASIHGGSSLYALDEEALAAAEPDLILTQELCRVCAVSYREVNEVARAIDADITVVSLEPTSIEGIFNTIATVGAMTEAEDAAVDLVETLRERLGRVEAKVQARRDAGGRPPRVVGLEWLDPPFAAGHWVPEQVRRAGGWELLGADGDRSRPDDLGRGRRGRPRDAPPDAVRLPPRRDRQAEWARTRRPPGYERPDRRPSRAGLRGRRLGVLQPARPARHRRHRAARRDLRPRRVRRHRRRRIVDAGRAEPGSSTAARCRSARLRLPVVRRRARVPRARTTSRAGRSSAPTASARPATTGSCASGCARR